MEGVCIDPVIAHEMMTFDIRCPLELWARRIIPAGWRAPIAGRMHAISRRAFRGPCLGLARFDEREAS
jgi:hypothetical protein